MHLAAIAREKQPTQVNRSVNARNPVPFQCRSSAIYINHSLNCVCVGGQGVRRESLVSGAFWWGRHWPLTSGARPPPTTLAHWPCTRCAQWRPALQPPPAPLAWTSLSSRSADPSRRSGCGRGGPGWTLSEKGEEWEGVDVGVWRGHAAAGGGALRLALSKRSRSAVDARGRPGSCRQAASTRSRPRAPVSSRTQSPVQSRCRACRCWWDRRWRKVGYGWCGRWWKGWVIRCWGARLPLVWHLPSRAHMPFRQQPAASAARSV